MYMQILLGNTLNIHDHLATEEYLLYNSQDNFLYLWRSNDCVVCGKHQNLYAEINLPYVLANNISPARRISGGGTVYQDPGNINFTFILNSGQNNLIDFEKQTKPIVDFLNTQGVPAYLGKRNNLFVGENKISGNAEHLYKKRVLHHGTLLFNADLDKLQASLLLPANKYQHKAILSVPAKVANIKPYLTKPVSIEGFIESMAGYFLEKQANHTLYQLSDSDLHQIDDIKQQKFITPEWIYGYSPAYTFRNEIAWPGKAEKCEIRVKKGIIEDVACNNADLKALLINAPHELTSIKKRITSKYPFFTTPQLEGLLYSLFY